LIPPITRLFFHWTVPFNTRLVNELSAHTRFQEKSTQKIPTKESPYCDANAACDKNKSITSIWSRLHATSTKNV
jgi:hypothetical protein